MNQGKGSGRHVVDFNEAREQKLEEKRRKNERVLLKNMLGIYCVTEDEKIRAIDVIDVSENGLSFQLVFDPAHPWPRDEKDVGLRLYFTQDTYLPLRVQILNSRPVIDHGIRYVRYGCSIDPTLSSAETFKSFVTFLKAYSENAHRDLGDVTLFYL